MVFHRPSRLQEAIVSKTQKANARPKRMHIGNKGYIQEFSLVGTLIPSIPNGMQVA